jgi:prepilin-type processing-associated H-X9-DG protein
MTNLPPAGPVPPPPYQPPMAPPLPAEQSSKGKAVASFVLGLSAFMPFVGFVTGIVAIAMGRAAHRGRTTSKGLATAGIVLGVLGLTIGQLVGSLTIALWVPTLGRARELAKEAVCRANLSSISQGINMYQEEHGTYPASLTEAVATATDYRRAGGYPVLHCPSDQADRSEISYLYAPPLPSDLRVAKAGGQSDKTLLVIERADYHSGMRHVLYIDGSVERVTARWMKNLLAMPQNQRFKMD